MDSGLQDKVVLITGASGGIGRACAKAFAAEGAKLLLHGHRNVASLHELQSSLNVDSLVLQADLAQEGDVQSLFQKSFEHFGRLDALIANAAIWPPKDIPIDQMSLTHWEKSITINQTSVFLCAREFFGILKRTQPKAASLVIIGSSAAIFGEEAHVDYSASKAAISYGMTRTLKNEIVRIVPQGRVNAVCPGWTRTPMAEPGMNDPAAYARAMQTRALPRITEPEEVAPLVVFLSSDRLAGQITGEVIAITGGMEGRVLHQIEDIPM